MCRTACLIFSSYQTDYLSIKFWSINQIGSRFKDLRVDSSSAQSCYLFLLYSHSCWYVYIPTHTYNIYMYVFVCVLYCRLCFYVWFLMFTFFIISLVNFCVNVRYRWSCVLLCVKILTPKLGSQNNSFQLNWCVHYVFYLD